MMGCQQVHIQRTEMRLVSLGLCNSYYLECCTVDLNPSKHKQNFATLSLDTLHGLGLPHSVQQSAIIFDPQQLIRHGHVVSHRLFPIVEEGVRSPDFTGHQVVEGQNIHRTVKFQPLILPALPEENVYGVFLWAEEVYMNK